MINNTDKPFKVLLAQIKNNYDLEANTHRINISLQKYTLNDQIDLVLFPEIALTGYYHKDVQSIEPYAEEFGKGPHYEFCKAIALKLHTYVICGYPEKCGDKYYNSGLVVDRQGNAVHNIRKKHLFETDKTWAQEGEQFSSLEIENSNGQKIKFAFGICMDINCWEFKDNSQFELAQYCRDIDADGLIFLTAWNDHAPQEEDLEGIFNYWLWRLRPLIFSKENNYKKPFVFICADKVGEDEKTTYLGGSCVMKFNPVRLIQNLDKKSECYLLCELQI